jgi:[protein-PII] uridylyltransferase
MTHALPLGVKAIQQTLNQVQLAPTEIDDFIVVSCTGVDTPGLDIKIAEAMEMSPYLRRATLVDSPRPVVRRKLPRKLRHFSADVRVDFKEDPEREGTVLHLACNDQPGLLSRVAEAIHERGIQVHTARIATFGEKVEDTFLLSDAQRQPLSAEAQEKLHENLLKHLENESEK